MNEKSLVIDIHYHYLPLVPEELVEFVAQELVYGLKKNSRPWDAQTLIKLTQDTIIDPDGSLVLSREQKLGVDITCINTMDVIVPGLIEADTVLRSNKMAADLASQNPGKIFAFAGIDPRRPEAAELAETCLETYGMIGVKWHPDNGFDPSGSEAREVLTVLDRKGGILLVHTGYMPGGRCKYCSFDKICDILCDFPNIKVIAAHMGKTAWQEFAGLAHDFPNLYGDLAVWSRYADRNYDFFCRQLRELTYYAGVDKVLWGTDDPFENYTVPTHRFLQMMRDLPEKAPKGYDFSQEEVDLMLGGNAARLLGMTD